MSSTLGDGEGADEVTASAAASAALTGIIRLESSLVRWDTGQAVFRVRLTRVDGAFAEAHGAAHESESGEYWSLAEERALTRAAALLELMAAVQSAGAQSAISPPRAAPPHAVPPAARNTPARPEVGRTGLNAPSNAPPAARRPASGSSNAPGAGPPRTEREAPQNGSRPSAGLQPPSSTGAQRDRPAAKRPDPHALPSAVPTSSDDPFEPDLPEEDPFEDDARAVPPVASDADHSEKPAGHIRGEPGGAGGTASDSRTPRTQPTPAAT
ncbi:MAG TPA: hypothetical protein VFJ58_13925, partial [Armatimonadota bacterium]|nr:hypothetical protein [Armatimonadota bacterium]